MKKIRLILCTIILTVCACKKQVKNKEIKYDKNSSKLTLNDFNGDTLAYVQNKIIDRKDYYIGKKFDVLLNDLNIPIKSFLYSGNPQNILIVNHTIFLIYDGYQIKNKLDRKEIPVNLVIEWNPPLKSEEINKLNSERGKRGEWNQGNEAYFREQIVGDLQRTFYEQRWEHKN